MKDIELFDKTALECCKLITQSYSTNYTLGIRMIAKKYHPAMYAIYAFARIADEIVDTFPDADREVHLRKFKEDTFNAINSGSSSNPVLHGFQLIYHKYNFQRDWVETVLRTMEIDLDFARNYNDSRYHEYISGALEVPGLMCLKVFCEDDCELFSRLEAPMRSLFRAFQKVNILRDMKSDFLRGRVYFPGVDYNKFDADDKKVIENDIQMDFDKAFPGINQFPEDVKLGMRIIYRCYKQLFDKIRAVPPELIKQERIRTSDFQKFVIIMSEKHIYSTFFVFLLLLALFLQLPVHCHIMLVGILIMIGSSIFQIYNLVKGVLL